MLAPLATVGAERLAITFDDLPLNGELPRGSTRSGITRDVLAILDEQRVGPVYGFVNAGRPEHDADAERALRLWMAGGQRVANHTYRHSDLSQESTDEFLRDVAQNEPTLERLDPSGHWRWFRYPFLHEGDTAEKRDAVRAALLARGYRIAQVTIDWQDYLWNFAYARCRARDDRSQLQWLHDSYLRAAAQAIDTDRAIAQRLFGRPIDHVLLLHLGAYSPVILPDLLGLLRAKGFTVASLDTVGEDAALQAIPDLPDRRDGTLLEQEMKARGLTELRVPAPDPALETICRPPASP